DGLGVVRKRFLGLVLRERQLAEKLVEAAFVWNHLHRFACEGLRLGEIFLACSRHGLLEPLVRRRDLVERSDARCIGLLTQRSARAEALGALAVLLDALLRRRM